MEEINTEEHIDKLFELEIKVQEVLKNQKISDKSTILTTILAELIIEHSRCTIEELEKALDESHKNFKKFIIENYRAILESNENKNKGEKK